MNSTISKLLFGFLIGSMYLVAGKAQVTQTDSIDQVLKSMKEDTAKVNLLVNTGKKILNSLPEKAFNYSIQAIDLSKKINYSLGLANGYYLKSSYYLNFKMDIASTSMNLHLADSIYQKNNEHAFMLGRGMVLLSYGAIQQYQGNYPEAMEFYIKSSVILDSLHNNRVAYVYYNLSTLYQNYMQFEKQEFYAKACLKAAEDTKNMSLILLGSSSLASALIYQKKYEQALPYILKTKKLAEATNDQVFLGLCYTNLGEYYSDCKKDYPQAIINLEKAYEQAKIIGRTFEQINNLNILSACYLANRQFDKAKASANEANKLLKTFKSIDLERTNLNTLAQIEAHFGEYKKAYNHLFQSCSLKDSVIKDENKRQINYLEALYQSEKREKEINQLQSNKRISELTLQRRNGIIYVLLILIVLLNAIAFLFNRNVRRKRIIIEQDLALEKQKTKELEKDRQIVATHAVLIGEETERKRLARDLHDGLGGLLSGVKLNLSNLKGNFVLSQETSDNFSNAINLLDNSINELRRIARNMMPESLVKFGLKDSLQDFCSQIESGSKMKVQFQFFGEEKRAESIIENAVYRIAQELINNSLKHAEADEILVQLIQQTTRLHLTVQDNGKGFDLNKVDTSKSSGIKNIRARIESFNGKLDIISEPGKGTEVSVEFIFS